MSNSRKGYNMQLYINVWTPNTNSKVEHLIYEAESRIEMLTKSNGSKSRKQEYDMYLISSFNKQTIPK